MFIFTQPQLRDSPNLKSDFASGFEIPVAGFYHGDLADPPREGLDLMGVHADLYGFHGGFAPLGSVHPEMDLRQSSRKSSLIGLAPLTRASICRRIWVALPMFSPGFEMESITDGISPGGFCFEICFSSAAKHCLIMAQFGCEFSRPVRPSVGRGNPRLVRGPLMFF